MSRLNVWREPSNLVAALAVAISLISLVVSVRSCVVAEQSLKLSLVEFKSQRAIILGGEVVADGTALRLKALDSNVVLQEARAVFPSGIDNQEWPVLPPNYDLYIVCLVWPFRELLRNALVANLEPSRLHLMQTYL